MSEKKKGKYWMCDGLDLNGYKPYYYEEVKISGWNEYLLFLSKKTPQGTYKEIRTLLSDAELLTRLEMTDNKPYYLSDGVTRASGVIR